VAVAVEDRGPGLTTEQRERAFERFYRGDGSRSAEGGGAGLGLAIVAAIVSAHGGSVDVVSVPGEGATFEVRLPRLDIPDLDELE
jgi:two-component system OmpR family sensor kinase